MEKNQNKSSLMVLLVFEKQNWIDIGMFHPQKLIVILNTLHC